MRARVARARADLTQTVAARYRQVVESGQDARWARTAAAAYVSLDRIRQVRLEPWQHRFADVRRRRRVGPNLLVVERAALSSGSRLALTLSGAAPLCAAVRAITLNRPDGSTARLPTDVSVSGDNVRLGAAVPAGMSGMLGVDDGRSLLAMAVLSRSVLTSAWPVAAGLPRLQREDGLLTVTQSTTNAGPVAHTVSLGLTRLTIRWSVADAGEDLRARSGSDELVTTGRRDGAERVGVLPLAALAERGERTWLVELGQGASWYPVQLDPRVFPSVGVVGDLAVPIRIAGRSVPVRVGYRSANRLAVEVGR